MWGPMRQAVYSGAPGINATGEVFWDIASRPDSAALVVEEQPTTWRATGTRHR